MTVMQLLTNSRKRVVPTIWLIVYPLLIGMDLFTTYLCSPDLSHEANLVFRFFNWGWIELLIGNISCVIIVILLTILSNKYMMAFLKGKSHRKFSFWLPFIQFVIFYSNFTGVLYASITNNLIYLVIHSKTENILFKVAEYFGNFTIQKGANFYMATLYSILFVIGFFITIYRIARVKKYVQTFM